MKDLLVEHYTLLCHVSVIAGGLFGQPDIILANDPALIPGRKRTRYCVTRNLSKAHKGDHDIRGRVQSRGSTIRGGAPRLGLGTGYGQRVALERVADYWRHDLLRQLNQLFFLQNPQYAGNPEVEPGVFREVE